MARKNGSSGNVFLNNLAFVVIIVLAAAMVVSGILSIFGEHSSIVGTIKTVCLGVAVFMTVVASYYGTRGKKKMWFWVWLAASVLVVLGYVFNVIPWK